MYIGLLFWIIMLLWAVFGIVPRFRGTTTLTPYYPWVCDLLLFVLLFILGWHAFGAALHN